MAVDNQEIRDCMCAVVNGQGGWSELEIREKKNLLSPNQTVIDITGNVR